MPVGKSLQECVFLFASREAEISIVSVKPNQTRSPHFFSSWGNLQEPEMCNCFVEKAEDRESSPLYAQFAWSYLSLSYF